MEGAHGTLMCRGTPVEKHWSNQCTTATLRTPNKWPLLTSGRCLDVGLCYKDLNMNSKMVVDVGKCSLIGGGR